MRFRGRRVMSLNSGLVMVLTEEMNLSIGLVMVSTVGVEWIPAWPGVS
jgi:hypothetical protein